MRVLLSVTAEPTNWTAVVEVSGETSGANYSNSHQTVPARTHHMCKSLHTPTQEHMGKLMGFCFSSR